ncbi:GNAT family N-acetyltransferase [Paenibacillus thiaminolyticus]|uniref:GNAT family N-acetyltransferase n=1 Tax=Paenibacillus thiaminolyticus TaxID=49283 RepID=UPI003D282DEF
MQFRCGTMTQEEAEIIAKWQYSGIYSFYDMEADQEDLEEFIHPDTRGDHYFSVYDNDELAGFLCLIPTECGIVDIGLGLKPEFTGKGIGLAFLRFAIELALEKYAPHTLTLSVAAFNRRAITVYERAGFVPQHAFMQSTNGGRFEFVRMKYTVQR